MMKFAGFGRAAIVAVLFSSFAAIVPAKAEEPSDAHVKAARDTINALGVTSQFDRILPMIAERLKAGQIQAFPDLQEQISDIVDKKALELAPRRADLERESAMIYAKTFSADELKAIADFYQTEPGKKLLKDGPIAMRELLKAADIWGAGVDRDLGNSVTAEVQKLAPAPLPADALTPGAKPAAPAAAPAKKN